MPYRWKDVQTQTLNQYHQMTSAKTDEQRETLHHLLSDSEMLKNMMSVCNKVTIGQAVLWMRAVKSVQFGIVWDWIRQRAGSQSTT